MALEEPFEYENKLTTSPQSRFHQIQVAQKKQRYPPPSHSYLTPVVPVQMSIAMVSRIILLSRKRGRLHRK